MYIIVSTTYKYIGEIVGNDCINRATTIGHEIHITRPILLFLLCQNLISTDDIIVTKNNERFFLYSDIFKNIIEYDDLPTNLQKFEIADITHVNSLLENKTDLNFKIDIEEKFPILKKMRNNEILIKTEKYNHYMEKINYMHLSNLENDYIVIHDRHTSYSSHDINPIQFLVNSILNIFPHLNIVIFSIALNVENTEKIKIIKRIDEYASYMNNNKCKAVISPFSGGGQLAQYCHNKFLFYYYCKHAYAFYPGYNMSDVFQKGNDEMNMYTYFDLKKITDVNVFTFDNYYEIIDNLKKVII